LNGYEGKSIQASGDLRIYASGDSRVSGASSSYGFTGIDVSGNLTLTVAEGVELTVFGGDGRTQGGNGITCSSFTLFSDGTCNILGGNTSGTDIVLELAYTEDTPPICKVFALASHHTPVLPAARWDLSQIS